MDACHGGCGGIWFDTFELQRVDERCEVPSEHLLRIQTDPQIRVEASRKRACPRCDGIKLKRHFSSRQRQVEVDHCPNCAGYWLDAGELEKIRAEKESGGTAVEIQGAVITMETIRFLYRLRIEREPE